ncbi:pentatricopeptide repeat-containing protein At3g49740 [Mercurialis annua]|uniref:pentatricopeptide repeat-containing protein At3g49740 n=1 Tax=Mercurialis annua TaxID=3986 RepID=UPI00216051E2|nr:pentatricopeptide repeat-containing protein At3g49740 [Mercurialis annua]XP_050204398.1 pentatricopeptide repeat-containing protein At3g49740 [Mercurialis annua]
MRKVPLGAKLITTITETTAKQQQQLIKLNCQLANLTRSHQFNNALHLFDKIRTHYHHLKPDHYTLSTTLTACANSRAAAFGGKLHSYSIKSGLKAYTHVANTLLSLYAKLQDIDSVQSVFDEIDYPSVYSYTTLLSACTKMDRVGYACKVFDEMAQRDLEVWNAMITGCMESGNEEIGISLFRDMCRLGVKHDNYSIASVLSGCELVSIDFGMQVHSLVVKTGSLVRPSVVNSLITMYFNRENVEEACLVFKEAEDSVRNQITYNVMIDGLIGVGSFDDALIMFRKMLRRCLRPTEFTLVSFMGSCLDADFGYQCHALAIKMGFEACTFIGNATVTMYSNLGELNAARVVFERLPKKDLVSWNTMISSYAQGNFSKWAILTFLEMRRTGTEPDDFTFGSLLASLELVEIVEMVHAVVVRNSLISNMQVSNALISAYSKNGNIEKAYQIFGDMSSRNIISWNSIISGFLLNELPLVGLEKFVELQLTKLRPNEYTISIVLSICAGISSLRQGKQVHGYIMRLEFTSEGSLGNILITMYAKCGLIDWSSRVFNSMTKRDVVTWNALISAYAQHGKGNEAVQCFEAMQRLSTVRPNDVTFTIILSACSHVGLVDDGVWIFNSMVDKYGIIPGIDHFSCIVDLLGRAGYFDEVERIMKSEHFEAHPKIYWSLLSACAAHGNLKLGRLVAEFLLQSEENRPSVYVVLSNMYAAAGQWEEVANIRHLIDNARAKKQPGYSWISS